jgi:hypothetical protein
MEGERIEEILKESGFKYQGVRHNNFEKMKGRVYLKEGKKEIVFVKDNHFHISRDCYTLFRGELTKESDLNTIMRISKI